MNNLHISRVRHLVILGMLHSTNQNIKAEEEMLIGGHIYLYFDGLVAATKVVGCYRTQQPSNMFERSWRLRRKFVQK